MSDKSSKGTALVTGASSGIGAVYADRLARQGYDLILVARDAARLEALAKRLNAEFGVAAEAAPADLLNPDDRLRIERRLREDPAIALVVNNAGIALEGDVLGLDPDAAERLIDLNVVAAARIALAAADGLAARGAGTLVNIASVLALIHERFNGVYNATKAFVLSLSQSLARELEAKGVRVQAVLPGATRTEIWARAGLDINAFPPEMVMDVDDMVDAALSGLALGETVTIPALPDAADYAAFDAARQAMLPNLSLHHPADRYGVKARQAA